MADKLLQVREHLLEKIESGDIRGGDKLPGARELAEQLGVSLALMQTAFISLVRDGVLASFPRKGTFVRVDWNRRILPGSVTAFSPFWLRQVRDFVTPVLPEVRARAAFQAGMFEIRTTFHVQNHRHDYLDLAPLLAEAYPDQRDFFSQPFQPFLDAEQHLFGIPLIFSPRIICYNPKLIAAAGGIEPHTGWTWQEFIDLVKKLRKTLPPERIFNWSCNAGIWLTFVLNAGGCVVERQGGKATVRLDDPRTREGLRRALELCRTLGSPVLSMKRGSYQQEFFSGRNAMVLIPREEVNFDSPLPWKSVPVPLIPGGKRPDHPGDRSAVRAPPCRRSRTGTPGDPAVPLSGIAGTSGAVALWNPDPEIGRDPQLRRRGPPRPGVPDRDDPALGRFQSGLSGAERNGLHRDQPDLGGRRHRDGHLGARHGPPNRVPIPENILILPQPPHKQKGSP